MMLLNVVRNLKLKKINTQSKIAAPKAVKILPLHSPPTALLNSPLSIWITIFIDNLDDVYFYFSQLFYKNMFTVQVLILS